MPIVFSEDINKNQKIAVWKITESESELRTILKTGKRGIEELFLIKDDANRMRSIAARVLAQQICKEMNISYQGILKSEIGNPYLCDCDKNIAISHSDQFAAVHFSLIKSAGIDIQNIVPKIRNIQNRVFSKKEIALFGKTDQELTLLWASKECAFKTLQIPGVDFIDELEVTVFDSSYLQVFYQPTKSAIKMKYLLIEDCILVYDLHNDVAIY